jgi:hypothetical protein
LTLRIKVVPGSSRTEIAGELADGTLKLRVTAPAEKGKANQAVCALLAAYYRVPRSAVTILSGHAHPRKLVRIDK